MPTAAFASSGPRPASAALALWAVLCVAGIGHHLGQMPLVDPDEGRNAEVAREMAATGDWVVPRLDGLPYLDKPVLFFAAAAVAIKGLGATELAVRLPSLVAALATALVVAGFAVRLFGAGAGWPAGLAALTAPLAVAFARTVIFDGLLTFFVTLALVAFYLGVDAARSGGERRGYLGWTVLAWAAMGLGVLTKGPVALAVPLIVATPFALWRRAGRAVWHPLGWVALGAIAGPWVWAVWRRLPEFLDYALVIESWRRLTTPELNRTGPIWTFVPLLLGGALPWSAVALFGWLSGSPPHSLDPSPTLKGGEGRPHPLATIRSGALGHGGRERLRRFDPRAVYLALWIVLPFVFFSLSASKRPQYVLPLVPAVALLVAWRWQRAAEGPLPGARAAAAVWALLAAALAAGAFLFTPPRSMTAELAALVPAGALILGAVMIVGAALTALRPASRAVVLVGLSLPCVAAPAVLAPVLQQIGRQRSARELARAIEPRLIADAEVVGVAAYPLLLFFYLGRTMLLATPDADELRSNYLLRYHDRWAAAPGTPLRDARWWVDALAACERPRIFVVESHATVVRAQLQARAPLLADDGRYAAYGPCSPPPAAVVGG